MGGRSLPALNLSEILGEIAGPEEWICRLIYEELASPLAEICIPVLCGRVKGCDDVPPYPCRLSLIGVAVRWQRQAERRLLAGLR